MLRKLLHGPICVCLSPLLAAQQIAHTRPLELTIRRDTEINFITLEPVSSATASKRQMVRLAVATDLVIQGVVAIPKGTPATGEVSRLTKGVPGKRDGFIRVVPTSLTLADGTLVKLKENRTGEDDCADMGPCWVLAIVSAPLLPAILIKKLLDDQERPKEKPQGKEQILETGYPVEGFATNRIVVRATVPRLSTEVQP